MTDELITIVRAERTCFACPSQWDAWDSDGSYWYMRYRGGHGSARQYAQGPGWYELDGRVEPVAEHEAHWGHPLDGVCSLEEICTQLGFLLAVELKTADELYMAQWNTPLDESGWSWL